MKVAAAFVACALLGCTSVRMVQREGCWVKQTEKWPSRVSEEIGFCTRPAPVWAQDRLARLVQECVAQADYRWENRALAAWRRGDPIPPQDSDDKIAKTCLNESSAALALEQENASLKSRIADVDRDRQTLRATTEDDREFMKESNSQMVSALGDAAKRPPPSAVATATSTGTAKTESDLRQQDAAPAAPPTTVVALNGTPAQIAAATRPVAKPAAPCQRPVAAEKNGKAMKPLDECAPPKPEEQKRPACKDCAPGPRTADVRTDALPR
jgi:hypothetical protein